MHHLADLGFFSQTLPHAPAIGACAGEVADLPQAIRAREGGHCIDLAERSDRGRTTGGILTGGMSLEKCMTGGIQLE